MQIFQIDFNESVEIGGKNRKCTFFVEGTYDGYYLVDKDILITNDKYPHLELKDLQEDDQEFILMLAEEKLNEHFINYFNEDEASEDVDQLNEFQSIVSEYDTDENFF